MSIKNLKNSYNSKKTAIRAKLESFKRLSGVEQKKEFMFCILTPQSNAQKCWEAVEQIASLGSFEKSKVREIIKSRARFHNNKTKYLLEAVKTWNKIQNRLDNENTKELRNWLAENVKGYGFKEAGDFLKKKR